MCIIFYPAVSPKPLWHQGWVLWKMVFQWTGRKERFRDTSSTLCLLCTFSSVNSFSRVWLFEIPCTVARQASLFITNSRSLFKFMSIESVVPSNRLILCRPLLLHHVAKISNVLLRHLSFQWIFRDDFRKDGLVWSPRSPRDSEESSPTLNSKASFFRHSAVYPALTTVHDYWENQSFDYTDLCQQSNVSAFQCAV